MWQAQLAELSQKYLWVQIFENKGAAMGCSNPHPHGQIWANSFLPNEVAKADQSQRNYFQKHGSVLLLDYVQRELELKERVVVETQHWLAVVPYWAAWPFETLLLPKFHVKCMMQLTEPQVADFALILKNSQQSTIIYLILPSLILWDFILLLSMVRIIYIGSCMDISIHHYCVQLLCENLWLVMRCWGKLSEI